MQATEAGRRGRHRISDTKPRVLIGSAPTRQAAAALCTVFASALVHLGLAPEFGVYSRPLGRRAGR